MKEFKNSRAQNTTDVHGTKIDKPNMTGAVNKNKPIKWWQFCRQQCNCLIDFAVRGWWRGASIANLCFYSSFIFALRSNDMSMQKYNL